MQDLNALWQAQNQLQTGSQYQRNTGRFSATTVTITVVSKQPLLRAVSGIALLHKRGTLASKRTGMNYMAQLTGHGRLARLRRACLQTFRQP